MSIMGPRTTYQIQKNLPSIKTHLKNIICLRPSRTISIDMVGNCRLCTCGVYLPFEICNILDLNSFEEIWETPRAKEVIRTINERTYDYCDTESCRIGDTLPKKNSYINYVLKKYMNFPEELYPWGLSPLKSKEEIYLILGMDDSCNLQCPSCRLEKRDYNKPKNEIEKVQLATTTKLNNHITSLINNYNKEALIVFGASGDAFYSLATVNMITNLKYNPLHRYTFNTNGLSMKAVLPKLKILPSIERIDISIDGATKETHEKLRVGSNWNKLIDNIKWLAELPDRPIIDANFTVQNDNFREMPLFKEIMDKLGVDSVTYTLYNQWPHITDEIYKKNAIHYPDHINYQEYKNILTEFTKKDNISQESVQFINPFA